MNYILARLKEASTWRGLVLIATSFGVHLAQVHPENEPWLSQSVYSTTWCRSHSRRQFE